jgi:hypothetical protein
MTDTFTCRRCGQPIELPQPSGVERPTYHDTCWAEQLQANRDADWARFTAPRSAGIFYVPKG